MEKENGKELVPETVQDKLHKRLHFVFKNNRKEIFPFLKIAMERSVRSSKEVYTLSVQEAAEVMNLLGFFVGELTFSDLLDAQEGEMHRHFLWHSTREQLRVLRLTRKGYRSGEIARLLQVSQDWVARMQYTMLAAGASLGRFSPIESYAEKFAREDADIRKAMSASYCADIELFVARFAYKEPRLELHTCYRLCAYYAREVLAKEMFGKEEKELA